MVKMWDVKSDLIALETRGLPVVGTMTSEWWKSMYWFSGNAQFSLWAWRQESKVSE